MGWREGCPQGGAWVCLLGMTAPALARLAAKWCRGPRVTVVSIAACGWRQRLVADAGSALALLWVLALLCWAWGVGASRIVDFKHHPSDVVAGALLGTLFAAVYAVRSIARLERVAELAAGDDAAGTDPGTALDATLLPGGNRMSNFPNP